MAGWIELWDPTSAALVSRISESCSDAADTVSFAGDDDELLSINHLTEDGAGSVTALYRLDGSAVGDAGTHKGRVVDAVTGVAVNQTPDGTDLLRGDGSVIVTLHFFAGAGLVSDDDQNVIVDWFEGALEIYAIRDGTRIASIPPR